MWIVVAGFLLIVVIGALALYDVSQRNRAILRNFPILGHFRYWLEAIGPELRQYIVTSNDEERPFSRDQRRWIYESALKGNNYFGFGTDNDLDHTPGYPIIKQAAFPLVEPSPADWDYDPTYGIACAKALGSYRQRPRAFRPLSVVNISAMSYGSLSGPAIEALNRGSALASCLHNTGEGGIAPNHLFGGELIWQIGTGYFGCRDQDGRFSLPKFIDTVQQTPQIRAIEIKLSQGAKPGLGGILPAQKVTPEIAAIRGIPVGKDCLSPSAHTAFSDTDSLLDFVERLAVASGLPVGIKSAVGDDDFWQRLAACMDGSGRAVDFITIDGGEGGTGAGPLAFTDHVSLPFRVGFARVYRAMAEYDLHQKIVFVGSGRLGLPADALLAFGMGCDMIAVAREAMLAIGCIQAQRCQSGHCPTGVATQNRWFAHGLDAELQAEHFANYIQAIRKELLRLSYACGAPHPGLVQIDQFEILDGNFGSRPLADLFGYLPGYGLPPLVERERIWHRYRAGRTQSVVGLPAITPVAEPAASALAQLNHEP
jgi:glutamate synthase (ferredoxin)